jgi:hypothetical protein
MTKEQRLMRKIIAILGFIIGMTLLFANCTPKVCPTYDSAIRAEKQRGITIGRYQSNYCEVKTKKKKSKSIF